MFGFGTSEVLQCFLPMSCLLVALIVALCFLLLQILLLVFLRFLLLVLLFELLDLVAILFVRVFVPLACIGLCPVVCAWYGRDMQKGF